MTLIADFAPQTKVLYTSVVDNYARVLDTIEIDHDGKHYSRPTFREIDEVRGVDKTVLGLPDVWRINPIVTKGKPEGIPMTEDFQFWLDRIELECQVDRYLSDEEFEIFYAKQLADFKAKRGSNTINDFNSMFRANASHTNSWGTNNCASYISQERLDEALPIFQNIVTGGWVGKLKSPASSQLQVINASKGYHQYHPFTHPWLFDQPMSTGREFIGDTNVIKRDDLRKPYDYFGGKAVMPVMLPVDDYGVIQGEILVPSDREPLSKW